MQVRHPLTLITKETRPLDITVENTCLLLQDLHSPIHRRRRWLARQSDKPESSHAGVRRLFPSARPYPAQHPPSPGSRPADGHSGGLHLLRLRDGRVTLPLSGSHGLDLEPGRAAGSTSQRVAAGGRRTRLLQAWLGCPRQPQIRRLSRRKQRCQRRYHGRNAGLRRPADLPRAKRPGHPEPESSETPPSASPTPGTASPPTPWPTGW